MSDRDKIVPISRFQDLKKAPRVRPRPPEIFGSPFIPMPEGARLEIFAPGVLLISISPDTREAQREKWAACLKLIEVSLVRYGVAYELLLERDHKNPIGPRVPDAIKINLALVQQAQPPRV